MTKQITIVALLVAFVSAEANAQNNHTYRRRGAILGGLAGAAIGVAIGDKGNNETAGALIGGAVGAIAGGTIGNQKDQRIEHNYRYHSGYSSQPPYGYQQGGNSQYYQPRYFPQQQVVQPQPTPAIAPAPPVTQGVSFQDVVTMVRNGMSESMIIQQIELHGVERPLTVADVIELHQLGVSEPILTAMQVGKPSPVSPEEIGLPAPSYGNPPPAPLPATPNGPTAVAPYGPSVLAPANGQR